MLERALARPSAASRVRSRRRLLSWWLLPWFLLVAACAPATLADVKPRERKVLLIGIDGFDYAPFEQMLKEGQLQKLAELRRRGIVVPLIGEQANLDPYSVGLDPAESWTTIATGFPPTKSAEILEGHGVRDIAVPVKNHYERAPATTAHRQLPNFWSVLSATGVKSAIVNWPVSWPAEPLDGYVVSDRFFLAQYGLGFFGEYSMLYQRSLL